MPEIKHTFSSGKMNKDLDERLVPNGEYRDAMNIQVTTSESSDVGTIENILGNDLVNINQDSYIVEGSKCVGTISDEKNDTIYWLIAGPVLNNWINIDSELRPDKDMILRYNKASNIIEPVVVDIYRIKRELEHISDSGLLAPQTYNVINYGVDQTLRKIEFSGDIKTYPTMFCNCLDIGSGRLFTDNPVISSVYDSGTDTTEVTLRDSIQGFTTSTSTNIQFQFMGRREKRVLNFSQGKGVGVYSKITGINILENFLLWTDDYSEPKKINIENSVLGSQDASGNGDFHTHTKLIVPERVIDLQNNITFLREEHITVIKKRPTHPPALEVDSVKTINTDAISEPINFEDPANINEPLPTGSEFTMRVENTSTTQPVGWSVGDTLLFKELPEDYTANIFPVAQQYDIRAEIIEFPGDLGVSYTIPPATTSYSFPNAYNEFGTAIVEVKCRIISIANAVPLSGNPPPVAGSTPPTPLSLSGDQQFAVSLEIDPNSLFRGKFPRFSYRYKYQDNEYSTFAPWSEIAFIPGKFDLHPTKGYNLGMQNTLQNLKVKNFIASDILENVVEVDILYKEDGSPTVYIIDTVSHLDNIPPNETYNYWNKPSFELKTITSTVLTSGSSTAVIDPANIDVLSGMRVYGDPAVPNGTVVVSMDNAGNITLSNNATATITTALTYELDEIVVNSKSKGSYDIKSETVFKTVSKNQTIRPWDNVPRMALCQEVVGNRIVYANYLQNYNMETGVSGHPAFSAGFETSLTTYETNIAPEQGARSIKSIRTYQIGISYLDEYGRETPIFTDKTGSIRLPKSRSDNYNAVKVKPTNQPPKFATHFKYYIKETSGDYYNLVMDRIYNAADGNVWLSFLSSDRNKLDEDTFLILKKGMGPVNFIEQEARYKVLAIENEAPDFIKRKRSLISARTLTTTATTDPANTQWGITTLGTIGDPAGSRTVVIQNHKMLAAGLINLHDTNIVAEKKFSIRFLNNTTNQQSKYYKVANINYEQITPINGTAPEESYTTLTIEKTFGDDTSFIYDSTTTAWQVDAVAEFWIEEIQNNPQFDGRFFVKILRDGVIDSELASRISADDTSEITTIAQKNMYFYGPGSEGNTNTSNGTQIPLRMPFGYDHCDQDCSFCNAHQTVYFETPWQQTRDWENTGWAAGSEPVSYAVGSANPHYTQFGAMNNPTLGAYGSGVARGHAMLTKDQWKAIRDGNSAHHWFVDEAMFTAFYPGSVGTIIGPDSCGNWHHDPLAFESTNTYFMIYRGTRVNYFRQRSSQVPNEYTSSHKIHAAEPRNKGIKTRNDGPYMPLARRNAFNDNGFAMPSDCDASVDISFFGVKQYEGKMTGSGTTSTDPRYHPGEADFIAELKAGNYITFEGDSDWHKILHVEVAVFHNYASPYTTSPSRMKTACRTTYLGCDNYPYPVQSGYSPSNFNMSTTLGDKLRDESYAYTRRKTWRLFLQTGVSNNQFSTFNPITQGLINASTALAFKIGTPATTAIQDEIQEIDPNPAVFETEPKESTDLDIYYEATPALHIDPRSWTGGMKLLDDGEMFFPVGSKLYVDVNAPANWTLDTGGSGIATIVDVIGDQLVLKGANISNSLNLPNGALLRLIHAHSGILQTVAATPAEGSLKNDAPAGTTLTVFNNTNIITVSSAYGGSKELSWFNCFSYANGVECDRIRDSFNLPTIDNGVKVSTTTDVPYEEDRRKHGLIFSGLYNSATGFNNLNQFILAEGIQKDINPSHGSIQKLHARDTDLVTLCEDKVLKILSNKDAVYNADGNPQLTATNNVLGQVIPFVGEYGISKNPESYVSESYRSYFTDKQRGAVLRLSRDGLTAISEYGMKDYFRDNLRRYDTLLGTFDDVKDEYNLTLTFQDTETLSNVPGYTLSFDERIKGWVSFKSFIPEQGGSVANDYYTINQGLLYKHHHSGVDRNTFYGKFEATSLTLLLNDIPSSVKSFKTLNYEGSQSQVSQDIQDGEYYNLWPNIQGWTVDYIITDQQEGSLLEFIEKEGKWFNYIKGNTVETVADIKTDEFSFQGIGNSKPDAGGDFSYDCVEITGSLTTTYECQQVVGTGGEFPTMAACEVVCEVPESWNCIASSGQCVDPGTGLGQYTTWALCMQSCSNVDPLNINIYDIADQD